MHGSAQVRLLVLSVLFAPAVLTAYPALQYDICRPQWLRLFRHVSLESPLCVFEACVLHAINAGCCRSSSKSHLPARLERADV